MSAAERPTLLVHGIFDSAERLAPLERGLRQRGVALPQAVELWPATGEAPLEHLAEQLGRAARAAVARSADGRVDVVGFSMGALVTRWWLQRGGGRDVVRRFVSISGPHQGTLTAFALPLPGARQMRPNSTFLNDLAQDTDPFGSVEVHCIYTPLDAVIVPARSSQLPHARTTRRFPVALHRWMIRDPRVLNHVAGVLAAP